ALPISHSAAALAVDEVDDFLVDCAAQHHLDHVHGLGVGDPHAADKTALPPQALQQPANLRTAAVHDHRIDADQFHHHDVAGEAVLEVLGRHGMAAVLDHHGLAAEALDVRQRFDQNVSDLGCRRCGAGHWRIT